MLWLAAIFTGLAFLVGNGMNEAGWGVTFGFAAFICAWAWFIAPNVEPAEASEQQPEYAPEPVQQAAQEMPQGPPPWMLRGFDDDHADLLPPTAVAPTAAPEAW